MQQNALANVLVEHEMKIRRLTDEAQGVRSFQLVSATGATLPNVEAGAHVALHLGNGLTRQYSLYNPPGETDCYQVAVLNDPKSRGGSRYVHEALSEGDVIRISGPYNHFPLATQQSSAVLIAGGIGITPILSMAYELLARETPFVLHYCARGEDTAAFVSFLRQHPALSPHIQFHFDEGQVEKGLNIAQLLAIQAPGQHVYCCGPGGLINAVEKAAAHWGEGCVHFERFSAAPVDSSKDQAFTVHLARSQKTLTVPPNQSLLSVLRQNGCNIHSVCENGVCGSCLVDVISGEPDHRDNILTDAEKQVNDTMASCCSRSKGGQLVLDL